MTEKDKETRTYRTESGKVLTDADIEALAAEAERGYDVSRLTETPASVTVSVAAQLRALAAEATPGPWRVETPERYVGDGDPEGGWIAPHGAYSLNHADNELMALAPELARWAADAAEVLDALARDQSIGLSWRPGYGDAHALLARLAVLTETDTV